LVRRVGFVGVFGFKYSERPGTPALKLKDDVTEAEKSRRLAALFALSEELRREHLERLVGNVESVLVEGLGKTGGYTGRTERNEIVHFGANTDLLGELVEVRIVSAFKHSLQAELVDVARRAPLPSSDATPEKPAVSKPGRVNLPVL
ncbi:MAG: TRAM domain-containing protein, partial [Polyangiaceae bacterium]